MKILNKNCIVFKSNPGNYLKEKYGCKPNTVRQIEGQEWVDFNNALKNLTLIRMINSDTGETFERKLTDIHQHFIKDFGRDDIEIWIFSWKNYKLIDD